jgi:release factor glutamine methyltransferase
LTQAAPRAFAAVFRLWGSGIALKLFPVTVLEAIQLSAEFLGKRGVDSPRLQAELLLANVLKLPRMQLYLNFERVLNPTETDTYRELVKRRGQREPLQQILGCISFCGVDFEVNRHVLVPRPETELLAEAGWTFIHERAKPGVGESGILMVLDFGTGSGCLAVTVALKSKFARVSGVDLSPQALEVAQKNATRHGVTEQVQFFLGDGFGSLPPGSRFDLILGNPPYIPSAEILTLQPEVRDFEPRQALDGGKDGLDFYRRLAREAAPFVNPGGCIMLEFGDGQGPELRQIFEEQKWIVERLLEDYTRRQRILVARIN